MLLGKFAQGIIENYLLMNLFLLLIVFHDVAYS